MFVLISETCAGVAKGEKTRCVAVTDDVGSGGKQQREPPRCRISTLSRFLS